MSKFTYIIRSINKEISTENTNNCSIRLMGLPQQYKRYKASVVSFYVSTNSLGFATQVSGTNYATGLKLLSNSIFELRADSLASGGIYDTNKTYNTVAFTTNNNSYPQWEHSFELENVNGRSVRFQLYDESNALLTTKLANTPYTVEQFNQNWILVLSLEGIEESPHKAI